MLLEKLLSVLSTYAINRDDVTNIEINNIHFDSREIKRDGLFIAIKGQLCDGHQYIESAIKNGAIAIIVEEFSDVDILQIKVNNTRSVLADLSSEFYNNPSEELFLVGITATNGKTTTSFMTKAIFDAYHISSGIIGTVEVRYKDVIIPSILTTPESRDLQMHMRHMVEHEVTDVIMEVSSHALEMGRIRNLKYNIVTFNNISKEHIDQHGCYENYCAIKTQLITEADKETIAILNYDFELIKQLADKTQARVLSYSMNPTTMTDFGINHIDLSSGYGRFDFIINQDMPEFGLSKGSYPIELGIAGYSSVMNAMVAIIIALMRQIPMTVIQEALNKFKGVERRFQMIYDAEYKIIDDHFANVNNIKVTMEAIKQMNYQSFKILYAIRGNRGVNLNRESAEETATWLNKLGVDTIYSTSSVETVTSKDRVLADERVVFEEVMTDHQIKVVHYDRLDTAVEHILEIVETGDLLLLAGCQGMDPGARILLEKRTEGMSVKERQEILNVLEGRAF